MSLLTIAEITVSIVLIVLILLQQRSADTGGLFGGGGGDGTFYQRRRGLERILFIATIVVAALFIAIAILNFVL